MDGRVKRGDGWYLGGQEFGQPIPSPLTHRAAYIVAEAGMLSGGRATWPRGAGHLLTGGSLSLTYIRQRLVRAGRVVRSDRFIRSYRFVRADRGIRSERFRAGWFGGVILLHHPSTSHCDNIVPVYIGLFVSRSDKPHVDSRAPVGRDRCRLHGQRNVLGSDGRGV
jgi:hypothetical protein